MRKQLTEYKFKKIATEAFKNGLRLHFDSILLFKSKSFPSAFQLSVLALEEFSKSNWVEHYYYSSVINDNFPDKDFEQEWLNLLYFHPKKQKAFFGWGMSMEYTSRFIKMIENGELEIKKQKAIYVGLKRQKKAVDVNGKISLPTQIKELDAKQLISLLSDYLKDQFEMKRYYQFHFEIAEKDALLTDQLHHELKKWKHRSGLKKTSSFATRLKKNSR
jgi:AbiV family abortive infection protein